MAFETTSFYFGREDGLNLVAEGPIHYSIVNTRPLNWDCGEIGYKMSLLKYKKEVAGAKALIDSMLKSANMKMRLATEVELETIYKIIETDRAEFEYIFDKDLVLRKLAEQMD